MVKSLLMSGLVAGTASAAALGSYGADASSVSVSGLSAGGFMAAQIGVAYSDLFKTGFGVFAGGPYSCARNNYYFQCMYNNSPMNPTTDMEKWSGTEIDDLANLKDRRIYMQVGSSDTTTGTNVQGKLRDQLAKFGDEAKTEYVVTQGGVHTFPTDFDSTGNSACTYSASPFISNCGYDGAGAVLQWMYGDLAPRNDGELTGTVVPFDQSGDHGAPGLGSQGFLYVPAACEGGATSCKVHVALHGCQQSYGQISRKFIDNTGYNKWADSNNIIIVYPQAVVDNTMHPIWGGTLLPNPNACFDWVGWYGDDADQKTGVQMSAISSMVQTILT